MDTRLIVERKLPDGRISDVRPFHISFEGMESALLCRDEEDYDQMVKNIFIRALKSNVIVIIYCVVSNHAHIAVLAETREIVRNYANDIKRVQSMWLHKKYGEVNVLLDKKPDIREIETMSYARNVLAYIPRNALDNGVKNIDTYKWTGYRGMFCEGQALCGTTRVSALSKRGKESIMHTGADLSAVHWLLNENDEIEPASTCDWQYLESIYNHSQSFFLRMLGNVNSAEMVYDQTIASHHRMTDSEFLKAAQEFSCKWYQKSIDELSPSARIRFLGYLDKKIFISVPQAARCLKLERSVVSHVLGRL